jgi:HrpA-like RNA helicase
MKILTSTDQGDILVFLPTVSMLDRGCRELQMKNKEGLSFCLMASGKLLRDKSLENKVTLYDPSVEKRKVVMSTPATEESITIQNLDYVVDSGLSLQEGYDPRKMARSLRKEYITKSSVMQRRGRTGRQRDGFCYHLYTKKQFDNFREFDIPQIKKMNLSEMILQITKMPLVRTYKKTVAMMNEFIEPPTKEAILMGLTELKALGVFTGKNIKDLGEISVIGSAMARLAMEPGMARTLLMAHHYYVRREMVFILAIIDASPNRTVTNLIMRPRRGENRSKRARALNPMLSKRGDYFTALKIYYAWEKVKAANPNKPQEVGKWASEHYINARPLKKVKNLVMRMMPKISNIVAPGGQEDPELKEALAKEAKRSERFKDPEANLVQAIKEGEGLIRPGKQVRGDEYKTIFPPDRVRARLSRDTILPRGQRPKPNIVYGELFIGDRAPALNNVTFL